MNVTSVEVIESKNPIELPESWEPAWSHPDGDPITALDWSIVRVSTDEGIVGYGPGGGDPAGLDIEGFDPFRVGEFWTDYLSGKRWGNANRGAAGVEIALWDILGKATGRPVHEILGAVNERLPVYAATSRLLEPERLADTVVEIRDDGFEAAKIRFHRSDPEDDLEAARTVRDAVGNDFELLVDANQNNAGKGYDFWSLPISLRVARELDDLGAYFLEEPRPRRDVEGLARIAKTVDMSIAGGEHSETPYDFEPHLRRGAYDILQPDVMLRGNMGISGLRRTAVVADYFGRSVIPHVISGADFPLAMAATLQAMATVDNCPMVEFPYDPPILTSETIQVLSDDRLWIDRNGRIEVPDRPGIGIRVNEDEIDANGEVVWSSDRTNE